jgi:hypothetical protein
MHKKMTVYLNIFGPLMKNRFEAMCSAA